VSRLDDWRRKKTPDVVAHMAAIQRRSLVYSEEEHLDAGAAWREALMLGLRLRAGVDPRAFQNRFGLTLARALGEPLAELLELGFLEWHADRLRLTDRALLVSNEVLIRLGIASRS
jgi:coproporphyrinogen III oxidase-like Fe-S oxidoreductase